MNKEPARQKQYNCRLCRLKEQDAERCCYWFNGEVHDLQAVQDVTDEDGNLALRKGQVLNSVSPEQLIDNLITITDAWPKLSTLQALKTIFPKVCPKSLLTDEIDMLLSMEMFSREYGMKPLGDDTGYLEYPLVFVETFGIISSARERVMLADLAEKAANK